MKTRVPKVWEDETCIIIAGGPSVTRSDLKIAFESGAKIITINDSWKLLPEKLMYGTKPPGFTYLPESVKPKSASYFCDDKWWRMQIDKNARSMDGLYSFADAIYKGWWWTGARGFDEHPRSRIFSVGAGYSS